jgi:hypothetical protein
MSYHTINSIILLIAVLAVITIGVYLVIFTTKYLEKVTRIKELSMYNNMFGNLDSAYGLLDSYIDQIFTEYQIFHQDIFSKPSLSNDDQTKIAKELTTQILDTMSPAFYSELALIFNTNREKLIKIVNNRVIMTIINYCINDQEGNTEIEQ